MGAMVGHMTTVVDLIRHGEPVGGRRYRGRVDDPLSERGWAQMWRAVGDHCLWQAVITSPLHRCRGFAEEFSIRHGLPLEVDERLAEIGFGSWEGRTADEVEHEHPGALMRFYADPIAHPPPGGEALEAFCRRVGNAWEDSLQRHRGQRVLVVGHAGVIRVCLALTLDLPLSSLFRIQVDNAGITRIQCDSEPGKARFCRLLAHGCATWPRPD